MLLRHRPIGLETTPARSPGGIANMKDEWIAVLRWLHGNHVEFVLVGAAAAVARGDVRARGPVAIVPAPYSRNLDRLSKALWSAHARLRVGGEVDTVPVKITPDKLSREARLSVRCGIHDLDIESLPSGGPGYQELLYEANRTAIEPGLEIEVAGIEDLERFGYARRPGKTAEIRITRASPAQR
jgi:hypothetical protein